MQRRRGFAQWMCRERLWRSLATRRDVTEVNLERFVLGCGEAAIGHGLA
jgi:hypothetical protein